MNSAFCVAVHALICLNRRQEQLSSEELARSIWYQSGPRAEDHGGAEAGRTGGNQGGE